MSATHTAAPTIATPRERPILFSAEMVRAILEGRKTQTRRVVTPTRTMSVYSRIRNGCPYGLPGDRLWVRESYFRRHVWAYKSCEEKEWLPDGDFAYERPNETIDVWWRLTPSIHMERGHSRITLEIASVRVQRLQEISEEDALAEGVDAVTQASAARPATWTRRQDFAQLWDRINAKRGFDWDVNPWVWVISFRRLKAVLESAT